MSTNKCWCGNQVEEGEMFCSLECYNEQRDAEQLRELVSTFRY